MTMDEYSSTIAAPPGGVFTEDVGVITGDVELCTTCSDDGTPQIRIRYAGADEWYTVRTGRIGRLGDPADAKILHDTVVAVLSRPEG